MRAVTMPLMPIPNPAAQPISTTSSAQQMAPSAARPLEAPQVATVPIAPTHNAITVQLQPAESGNRWTDPSILTAIVPALALLVTIWNTNKQLKAARQTAERQMQNAHERERLDRITKARQDIYGEILADYQRVQNVLSTMAEKRYDEPISLSELSLMSASVNKLWVWGEVESAYQVREFYSQVNEFAYAALAKAEAIRQARGALDSMNSKLETQTKEQERAEEALRTLRTQPGETHHEERWIDAEKGLIKQLEAIAIQKQKTMLQRGATFTKTWQKRQDYTRFIIDGQASLMTQINVVMSLARDDVGLRGDMSKLELQSHQMSERARTAIAKVEKDLQRELSDF